MSVEHQAVLEWQLTDEIGMHFLWTGGPCLVPEVCLTKEEWVQLGRPWALAVTVTATDRVRVGEEA